MRRHPFDTLDGGGLPTNNDCLVDYGNLWLPRKLIQTCNIYTCRWRFVIHGGIDGFSRMIVFLQCSTNNKPVTVLRQTPCCSSEIRRAKHVFIVISRFIAHWFSFIHATNYIYSALISFIRLNINLFTFEFYLLVCQFH